MPKRFTDSKIQSLKPTNKRAILFEDGGRGFGIRIEPSGRKSFFQNIDLVKGKNDEIGS